MKNKDISEQTQTSETRSNKEKKTSSSSNLSLATHYLMTPVKNILSAGIPAENYFKEQFISDVNNFKNHANLKTGLDTLDKEQKCLYPGLYVLGAVSSLGKTTFVHQICDNLASYGQYILYFSLEQTPFELFSKSISRMLALIRASSTNSSLPLYSSLEIRQGKGMNEHYVQQAINAYTKAVENRMIIIPSMFSLTIEDIISATNDFITSKGKSPIVVIDYLQIVEPSIIGGKRLDGRDAIDHIVHTLKSFQDKHDLIVILVSSLNRQNYILPIDYESFKESGGIEYTADVIWGLELSIINSDDVFKKDGNLKAKRDAIKNAKKSNPREIDLVCIKNRYGIAGYKTKLYYFPSSDYFTDSRSSPPVSNLT